MHGKLFSFERVETDSDRSAEKENMSSAFLNTIPDNYEFLPPAPPSSTHPAYGRNLSQTRKLETARRHAYEKYNSLLADVSAMEFKMEINRRWEPSDPEYLATVKYMRSREHQRALNELQRLVVLRLLELHKMNLGNSGVYISLHP